MIGFFVLAVMVIILGWLLPNLWWLYTIVAAIIGAWQGKSGIKTFLICFFSVFLVWSSVAIWFATGNALADKIAHTLSASSSHILFFLTGIIGGLVGGLGGLVGYYGKQTFFAWVEKHKK